jgi:2-dehydro-3-deoxygluconokinase
MLPHVDVLLVGDDEARALWGEDDDSCLDRLADTGPAEVVLKLGARGCTALVGGERFTAPGFAVHQVDPIGAGDAFAAGYLAASVEGLDPAERLRTANAMGAFCVQGLGDYEGLPSRRELTAFLDQTVDLGR